MSKTEKQKMEEGLLYLAYDKEFTERRRLTREILFDYNNLRPSQKEEKLKIIKNLFGKTGEYVSIGIPFFCDYGDNIFVGEDLYTNCNCIILDGGKVTIGNHVMIGPNVGLYTAGHPYDIEKRNKGYEYAFPITIGNNVWIGGHSVVLPGVNIGDNTIIGAGSVVTKDIPKNVLAAGNPCRVIREITEEDKHKYK